MNVSLVLVTEDGKQQELMLRKPSQVIGRHNDVAVRIPSATVSRQHCELTIEGDRALIKDLGSSNGTYVNRKKVSQAVLSPGDLLAVGDKVFVVRMNGEPARIDAEDAYEDGFVSPASAQAAPTAPTVISKPAPTKPAATPAATPAAKPAAKSSDLDDSSVADFDFLDEDDDLKKQPKL